MIIDQTGSLANVKRHDYLPFGEEIFAGSAGRTTQNGYTVGDGVRQQFTAKERDIETGLDYFLARYYASAQGRFTSADDPFADWSTSDPQRWNLYSYTSNNRTGRVDADGERWAKRRRPDGGWQVEWFDHTIRDSSFRTAYDRALLDGWSSANDLLLIVTEEGTGRRLLLGTTEDGQHPTREEITPDEEAWIRYWVLTLKPGRDWGNGGAVNFPA